MLLVLAMVSALLAEVPVTMQRLPDTGQTRRFADRDDSTFLADAPRLTNNGDGTVTDEITGLIWQHTDGGESKWEHAAAYCSELDLAGLTWRLPTNRELFSINHYNAGPPALDLTAFPRPQAEYWWSSELLAGDVSRAWAVNAGGGTGPHPQSETLSAGGTKRFHVRCVAVAEPRLIEKAYRNNGDGTITDLRTGLIWQEEEPELPLTWEDALRYAPEARVGGYEDWRVPNVRELQSLHEESRVRPAIDTTAFPTARAALYWSSTTQISRDSDRAWTLDFTLGIVSYNPKTDRLRVRLVRGPALKEEE